MHRHRWWLAALALALGFGVAWPTMAAERKADVLAARLAVLQREYRCPITAYLAEIHQHPLEERHRFLILEPRGRPNFYVQCLFQEQDTQLLCEIASGYYYAPLRRHFTPRRLAVVAALGFSTDASQGNFAWQRPVANPNDYYEVAGVLIEALARVFDFDLTDILDLKAPLVSNPPGSAVAGSRDCPLAISRR